jgi:hypothetical protein
MNVRNVAQAVEDLDYFSLNAILPMQEEAPTSFVLTRSLGFSVVGASLVH